MRNKLILLTAILTLSTVATASQIDVSNGGRLEQIANKVQDNANAIDSIRQNPGSSQQVTTNTKAIANVDNRVTSISGLVDANADRSIRNTDDVSKLSGGVLHNQHSIEDTNTQVSKLNTAMSASNSRLHEVSTQVNTNGDSITRLNTAMSASNKRLKSVDDQTKVNTEDIADTNTQVTSNTQVSSANAQWLATTQSDVNGLKSAVDDHTQDIAANNGLATDNGNSIDRLNTAMSASNKRVHSIGAQTDINTQDIGKIGDYLGIASGEGTNHPNDIQQLKTRVTSLDESMDETQSAISASNADIQDNWNHIAANQVGIQANTDDIAVNTRVLASNSADLADAKIDIEQNRNLSINNQNRINDNSKNIIDNTTKISNNTSRITANTSNISTNTKAIGENRNDITKNRSDIDNNTASISNVAKTQESNTKAVQHNSAAISDNSKKIDSVQSESRKGIALSSALSAIHYQAMTVGEKQIAFGTAVYKGENGVALGGAYQATENIQINMSVSGTTGSESQFVGTAGGSFKF